MTFHVLREISSDNNHGQTSLTFYVMIETFAKTYSTLLVNQEYYLQSSSLQATFQTYGAKYYADIGLYESYLLSQAIYQVLRHNSTFHETDNRSTWYRVYPSLT